MKKNIFILLALMFSVECIAGGVLKWKLKLSFKTDVVLVEEYDIINQKEVAGTREVTTSTKGNYDIPEPCIIAFTVTNTKTKITKSYVCPAMPGEEVIITDKNDGRYDIDGSDFYKRYHEIDLYVENLEKHKENIYSDFESYIKEHSNEETCAMMIPIALKDKEQIKTAANLLNPQLENSRIRPFFYYLLNQQPISRYVMMSFKDLQSIKTMRQIKIAGIVLNMKDCDPSLNTIGNSFLILKNKPYEMFDYYGDLHHIELGYDLSKSGRCMVPTYVVKRGKSSITISKKNFLEQSEDSFSCDFERPLYIEKIISGPYENFYAFIEKSKEVQDLLDNKEKEEKRRKEIEAERAREYAQQLKRNEEIRKKQELSRQEEAKAKKEWAKTVDNLREEMNKKYGKKWVDLADKGDIQVGMHEDLVAFVCKFYLIDLKTTFETKTFKKYDLYALRSVKTGYRESTIKNIWIGSIKIQNHKVISITRGPRWSN